MVISVKISRPHRESPPSASERRRQSRSRNWQGRLTRVIKGRHPSGEDYKVRSGDCVEILIETVLMHAQGHLQ